MTTGRFVLLYGTGTLSAGVITAFVVQNISVAYFPVVDTGDVVHYNLRILSATIMICYDREDCRKYNTTA